MSAMRRYIIPALAVAAGFVRAANATGASPGYTTVRSGHWGGKTWTLSAYDAASGQYCIVKKKFVKIA